MASLYRLSRAFLRRGVAVRGTTQHALTRNTVVAGYGSTFMTSQPVRSIHISCKVHSSDNDESSDAEKREATRLRAAERRLRVYTRTGDRGTSSLYTGDRRPKADIVFEALGDVDELNACIGVARAHCEAANSLKALDEQLASVQSRLLDVGSGVATPLDSATPEQLERAQFDDYHVTVLEQWIDGMDDTLPVLRAFILPSGGLAAAHLHHARTVCRRAERRVTELVDRESSPKVLSKFLNRLSDYLFVAARYAAQETGATETAYKKASS